MVVRENEMLTQRQRSVQQSVGEICSDFDDEYWREKDANEEYPQDFVESLASEGWLGALLPEQYGGKGYGTEEAVAMMYEIAASGAGFSGAQTVHAAIYNTKPILNYGTPEMHNKLLPRVVNGEAWIQCFSLTEPDAGSDSTAMTTHATQEDNEYIINGTKLWTSRIDVSDYLVLATRTTPSEEVQKKTHGISLFLVDIERGLNEGSIRLDEIEKTASGMIRSFEVQYDDLRVPVENRIGDEGS